jgi:hypothetical protein
MPATYVLNVQDNKEGNMMKMIIEFDLTSFIPGEEGFQEMRNILDTVVSENILTIVKGPGYTDLFDHSGNKVGMLKII